MFKCQRLGKKAGLPAVGGRKWRKSVLIMRFFSFFLFFLPFLHFPAQFLLPAQFDMAFSLKEKEKREKKKKKRLKKGWINEKFKSEEGGERENIRN